LQRTAAIAAHPIARLGGKGNDLQLYRARPAAAAEAGCWAALSEWIVL